MNTILARSLLAIEPKQVWDHLPDIFELVFDDGNKIITCREMVFYSSYIWIVHRKYPNTPLLYKHYIESVTGDRPMDSSTHMKLLTEAMKSCIETYGLIKPEQREELQELGFRIPNLILNEVYPKSLDHITTIDITDFTGLDDYEPMKEIVDSLKHDDPFIDDSIRMAYDKAQSLVMNDRNLDDNNLVAAIRCGMVSKNQFVQCSVVRGVPSEKNGWVMGEPILTNFARGMYRLYDILAESRSAAKAMGMQEDPLKVAEYFARRLQLLTMVVRNIHMEDCGSRKYTPWRVMPPKLDSRAKVIYQGDLPNLVGKYYLDEENSTEANPVYKVISAGDKHLYGKMIQMRTAYRCMHKDKYGVCRVCFGDLAYNISRFANLGHISAATMTQQTSQSVLSTKHLDASSMAADIELSTAAMEFFTTNSKRSAVFFRPEMKDVVTHIMVSQEETVGLVDIATLPWDKVNANRVSEISTLAVMSTNKKGDIITSTVEVKQSDRPGIFTIEFLEYLKENGWNADTKNMFVMDLRKWDFSKPIIKFPDIEYSYSDHSKQIATLIETRKLKSDMKNIITSVDILHQELFRLVNSKLNVSSSCLEVNIYALMVDGKNTYGMGRGAAEEILGQAAMIIKNRSLSVAYGYQSVAETIKNADSFFNNGRPDSVFDALIAPFEVVNAIKEGVRQ